MLVGPSFGWYSFFDVRRMERLLTSVLEGGLEFSSMGGWNLGFLA